MLPLMNSDTCFEIRLSPGQVSDAENIELCLDGSAHLRPEASQGICTWNIDFDGPRVLKSLNVQQRHAREADAYPPGDLLVQVRWLHGDTWSSWWPGNLLKGGDFRDHDKTGIPDSAEVLQFDSSSTVYSDLATTELPTWVEKHIRHVSPSMTVRTDKNRFLQIIKPNTQGQVIAQVRKDWIPDAPCITVSGWNGWDLNDIHTMGLMSRFHEIDAQNNRLNKIMFIGDDDWHQPGGQEALKWRAVTFVPRDETRRLNLYATRLISSPGTLRAANYQIRADSLSEKSNRGRTLFSPPMPSLKQWEVSSPGRVQVQSDTLVIRPHPHTNAYAVSAPFQIPPVERLAFSIEMEARVPDRYNDHDPSHKAWISTYLELLDKHDRILDIIKISACRPEMANALCAAGERPAQCCKGRFRLVASHQSYLPERMKQNMDGEMTCLWRNLELFECKYPTKWRGRLDEDPIETNEIPKARQLQVRALFLGRPDTLLDSITLAFE